MTDGRLYPEEPAGSFPTPPATVADREGRSIELRTIDGGDADDREALVEMYVRFDPTDRAQGIPPTGEDRVRDWIETIAPEGIHVVAVHEGEVAGHATLVPESDDPEAIEEPAGITWELAIFVLAAYQQAGIGTHLLEHLLGHAEGLGVERVWLTVERWNAPAIGLYESVGFERCGTESFEQEMAIRLA
ncbi:MULTISPECIES: GNAT family N-acetyltransferase [Saliphagus]|uniref:GNAT family N-acetyltransferase n=1 Tax=Saliphagus infecundisoli TaxID=1849069 RepID=A0ABD5QKQ1_9EURY|nr:MULTISPECIES: GNAT family N-acetyltransferase [Saliphagus]